MYEINLVRLNSSDLAVLFFAYMTERKFTNTINISPDINYASANKLRIGTNQIPKVR